AFSTCGAWSTTGAFAHRPPAATRISSRGAGLECPARTAAFARLASMRWVVALVFVALALEPGRGTAAAPSSSPLSVEQRDRFAAALATLRAGDAAGAARELADPVWAATPLQAYALLLRAEALLLAGDSSAARTAATRAVDDAPD